MSSVGREIENAIQSMLSISEEFAALQAKLDKANKDLNVLDTLFSVSKYISSDSEINTVLAVLEDSIKGVFGANECHVIFSKKNMHLSESVTLYRYLDYDDLSRAVQDVVYIKDVSKNEITTLNKGGLLLIRLSIGEELYGFLAVYWVYINELTSSSQTFLRIISNQVSMYLKSAQLVDKFKQLAISDPLTGIYNRSHFTNIETTSLPILGESIIMFDLDNFKHINDTFGHQYGDKVIKQFADTLVMHTKDNEALTFRYGGEEFIVKCFGGEKAAWEIAEAVRLDFEAQTGFTVSSGVSTMGSSCNVANYKHLIESADEALYVSKQLQRNRTTINNADIQVIKRISDALAKFFSKAYRGNTDGALFRLKLNSTVMITEEQYVKLKQVVMSVTRMYDDVFFTPSLDIFIIINGKISEKTMIARIENLMRAEIDFASYKVYNLHDVYKNILTHSRNIAKVADEIAIEMRLDQSERIKLNLLSQWHDVGKISINPSLFSKDYPWDHAFSKEEVYAWINYNVLEYHPMLTELSEWIMFYYTYVNCENSVQVCERKIPLFAQIFTLVDTFSKMTKDTFFADNDAKNKAIETIRRCESYYNADLKRTFIEFTEKNINVKK